MSSDSEPARKKHFWQVDSSIYKTSGEFGPRERLLELLQSVGKSLLWLAVLTYPFTLPLVGILFGGLAFWAAFGGSVAVIALLLQKFGYARTFARRDFPFLTSFAALAGGFLIALGFYLGLFYLKWILFPLAIGLMALVIGIWLALRNRS